MSTILNYSTFALSQSQIENTNGGGRVSRTRRRAYAGGQWGTQIQTAVSEDENASMVMTAESSTATVISYCRAIPTRTR